MASDADFLAKWWREVTKPSVAAYNLRMKDISPYRGSPRWEREAREAERDMNRANENLGRIYSMAHSDLEILGEISEAVWFAIDQASVTHEMQAAE